MKNWRLAHRGAFGYFRWLSVLVAALMVIISVTGVLYNHHHDWPLLAKGRVPTAVLPVKYAERLERTREAQGLGEVFPGEASSVPAMWVVADLHTGAFLGPWGRLAYDVVGVMFIVLSVTGIYLYLRSGGRPSGRRRAQGPTGRKWG